MSSTTDSGKRGGADSVIRPPTRSTAAGQCTVDADCDDGLACTENLCSNGLCDFPGIPTCVPCEWTYDCRPVDLVVIMDTSGSMRDEADVLCAQIQQILTDLQSFGIQVAPAFLGITELPGGPFDCLQNTVVNLYGSAVPGELSTCPFPEGPAPYESWGPAIAIVAEKYPWTPGATRLIVPLSDEGPCNGSRPEGCTDPGDDRDSIENAILVALANEVRVSPMAGTSSDECVINLGSALAKATGGALRQSKYPKSDLGGLVTLLVQQTCVANDQCDDQNACTLGDRCVEGVCEGKALAGCRPCAIDADCADQNACTDDACTDGICQSTPSFDTNLLCCNPESGVHAMIDDKNVCTDDSCDPATGIVSHAPVSVRLTCDDGDACTIQDACEDGQCTGAPLTEIPCDSDEDCAGNLCIDAGYCVCQGTPRLCLTARPGVLAEPLCYQDGDDIFVDVTLEQNEYEIAGGQFMMNYDPALLDFVGILPGKHVDPDSPFELQLSRSIDETSGDIFYAVGIALGGELKAGTLLMARMQFKPSATCADAEVCFQDKNPLVTRLSDGSGHSVPFYTCCTGALRITGEEPSLLCPASKTVNADAGDVQADVVWNQPVSVAESCPDDAVQILCSGENSLGLPVDDLVAAGGRFPPGKTTISCSALDSCGAGDQCQWDVTVKDSNTVEVDVQFSPIMTSRPFQRCIEFEFYTHCNNPPVTIRKAIDFGPPYNYPGQAVRVKLSIPAGQYTCATARDPLHTLRSSALMEILGTSYVAHFKGDPILGGNWLFGGNLNGDRVIDSLDHALFMTQYLVPLPPDTPCDFEGTHADLNADGQVNLDDLSILQRNFLTTDKTACCEGQTAAGTSAIVEISLEELAAFGFGDLNAADLNGDGVLNMTDMNLLLIRNHPKPPYSPARSPR